MQTLQWKENNNHALQVNKPTAMQMVHWKLQGFYGTSSFNTTSILRMNNNVNNTTDDYPDKLFDVWINGMQADEHDESSLE